MRRRQNKSIDLVGLAGSLAGLVVMLLMVMSQARSAIMGILFIVLAAIGLGIAGLVAVMVYCRTVSSNPFPVGRSKADGSSENVFSAPREMTPQSTEELIQQLRAIDWFQFEKIVALIYRKLGYNVTRRGGANPDGGIDLVIEKYGRKSAVQCKQWKTWNVGVKAVREFLGALKDSDIEKGIFITLRGYTGDAKILAEKHHIEIVNETGIAKMLKDTDARFDPEALIILRDQEKYCPKCESRMVLRTSRKGDTPGRKFWGCSYYPRCRFILEA